MSCPGPRAGDGVPMALNVDHRTTAASGVRMRAGPGVEVRSGAGAMALSRWLPSALVLAQTSGSSALVQGRALPLG